MSADLDDIDFALAAFHQDGRWQVSELAHDHLSDVEALAGALRRLPGELGAVAMVAVDDDFFLLVRVDGTRTRVVLSDLTAAEEWDLAASAVDHLGLPLPDDDDEQVPAGDLAMLADLGLSEMELAAMLDDADLYPDELLSDVARRLGFGALFDDAVGLAPA